MVRQLSVPDFSHPGAVAQLQAFTVICMYVLSNACGLGGGGVVRIVSPSAAKFRIRCRMGSIICLVEVELLKKFPLIMT